MFICDSSFLIAFYNELDDSIDILIKIRISNHNVEYNITPLIKKEVSKKHSDLFKKYKIFPILNIKHNSSIESQYAPFLNPFVGKGEREVIICSLEHNKTPILDDNLSVKVWRKITGKNPMRTCQFIVESCCTWNVTSETEAISILRKLQQKGFRIDDTIVTKLIYDINNC